MTPEEEKAYIRGENDYVPLPFTAGCFDPIASVYREEDLEKMAKRIAELEERLLISEGSHEYTQGVLGSVNNENESLRARIAELEAHRLRVAQAVGIVYQADGHADAAGPDSTVLGEIERLKIDASKSLEYERDWYAAKQDFGNARANLMARIRDAAQRLRDFLPGPHEGPKGLEDYLGELGQLKTARPLDKWHEDYGDALWWYFPVCEPPYCGSPLDENFPDYVTHWTPIVCPDEPELSICANGSPAPHESADWRDTLHARDLRIEQLERQLAEARAAMGPLGTPPLPNDPRLP